LRIVLLLAALLGAAYVYQRWLLTNFHVVVPGKVYRSAQPSPAQIRNWAQRYRLKTVVNLRGASDAEHFRNEQQAAESAGVQLVPIRLSARDLPSRPALLKLIEVLETGEMPMLIHCFAGADRSGMASVLAAMAVGGEPYDQARKQMSWRYLHVDDNPEHIAGLLHKYEQWCAETGRDTAGWQQFRRWAVDVYRVKYYFVRIDAPEEVRVQPGQTFSLALRITNCTRHAIPAGQPDKQFRVSAFSGSSLQSNPDEVFASVALPASDIQPGQSVNLHLPVRAPPPGVSQIHLDLVEEHVTWFAEEGSPVTTVQIRHGGSEDSAP
jgi:protein tyrosine/serine phosphatase